MFHNSDIAIAKRVKAMRMLRMSMSGTIGFIPTMGFLHDGHISLIRRAQKENDHVVVSIFINPKQFGSQEDFNKYPRDIKRDLQLLKNAQVDCVYLPHVDEIYQQDYETYVSVTELSKRLEGEKRPGHFDGVTTIVLKFFNTIQPDRSYFGQKDAQQVVIIKKMVSDLQIPVSIIIVETVRESDGLAMSSRNVFLNSKERKEAAVLFQSLTLAQELFNSGEHNAKKIKNAMQRLIQKTKGKIDYISIADPLTLDELISIDKKALVSLAVYYRKTRLIDTILL